MSERPGFGLYVHWPFCQAKCPYCDFNSHVVARVDQSAWAKAYEAEIGRVAEWTGMRQLDSIFFGGGTPSLMEPATVERVITAAQRAWRFSNNIEITLEANPTSVEAGRFRGFRSAGVNRVSVGLQALNDADLRALGRLHNAAEGRAAFELAREVFPRASFDLIYARQRQSLDDWEAELSTALGFGADHMSLYQLTIEPGTAFGDRFAKGSLRGLPDEDLGADLYELTQTIMETAGLPAYETSNHAVPGAESRHNLIYWRSGDWAGVGPGAHGRVTVDGKRYATDALTAPGAWIEAVRQGLGSERREALTDEAVYEERMMMGLRLRDGIDGANLLIKNKVHEINCLLDIDVLDLSDGRLRLTPAGRPLLNAVLRQLLA